MGEIGEDFIVVVYDVDMNIVLGLGDDFGKFEVEVWVE